MCSNRVVLLRCSKLIDQVTCIKEYLDSRCPLCEHSSDGIYWHTQSTLFPVSLSHHKLQLHTSHSYYLQSTLTERDSKKDILVWCTTGEYSWSFFYGSHAIVFEQQLTIERILHARLKPFFGYSFTVDLCLGQLSVIFG